MFSNIRQDQHKHLQLDNSMAKSSYRRYYRDKIFQHLQNLYNGKLKHSLSQVLKSICLQPKKMRNMVDLTNGSLLSQEI
jgi:hypothetical protein